MAVLVGGANRYRLRDLTGWGAMRLDEHREARLSMPGMVRVWVVCEWTSRGTLRQ